MSDDTRLTAEEAEEYTQSIGQITAGAWRQIAWAQRNGVPAALGLTTEEWVSKRLGGYVKQSIPKRREIVKELTEEGLSSRQVGEVLGVDHATVARDAAVANATPGGGDSSNGGDLGDAAVANATPGLLSEQERRTAARRDRDKKAEAKRKDRDDREAKITDVPPPIIREGRLSAALADITGLDLIFTDPPYPREFLPAWTELAEWAAGALKPGALLIAYSGQYHLPEVLGRLAAHLDYQWLGWLSTAGPNVSVRQRPIQSTGKPLLVFSNGKLAKPFDERRFLDSVDSEGRTREKHVWEQAEGPAAYYIEALTERGEYVADPFLGSGTFACVAAKLGRRFVGCDIDPAAVHTTRERLAA